MHRSDEYLKIVKKIQADITFGNYKAGDKLPSVRDLASEFGVNPNTMQRALSFLEESEIVFSTPKK